MTAERLLGVVGDIRDEYVQEADKVPSPVKTGGKKRGWVKWVAVAACLVVVALIAVPALQNVLGGGNARMPHERDYVYNSYEELSVNFADTVFEALASSSIAQQHKMTFGLVCSAKPINDTDVWDEIEWGDEYLVEARVAIDAPGSKLYGEDVPAGIVRCVDNETDSSQREYEFGDAERLGARADYMVDGIEVQKYEWYHYMDVLYAGTVAELPPAEYQHTSYQERVNINGVWYYVYSADEDLADAVASELARIAASLAN